MPRQIINNANIVLPQEVIKGSVMIENGLIQDIDQANSRDAAAQDWNHDYLIPGLVELHTDNMEKHFSPRPGVSWPKMSAILAHDTQMVSSGITTVFDAVAVGYHIGESERAGMHNDIVESISYISDKKISKSDHFLHLRCELSSETTASEFDRHADNPRLKLVSLMDHAPGQRQFVQIDKYIAYYRKKYGFNEAEMARFIEQHKCSSATWSESHRRYIAQTCRSQSVAIASHDDATPDHVNEALGYDISIAEFPTTIEAASLSHQNNMKVLMGAPNIIRGHSHSGNIAARELAEAGCLDILSSDYYPSSLLQSSFMLADLDIGYSLPQAIRCVTDSPAKAVGLEDRGRIEKGYIADFLRVARCEDIPILKETWKSGVRVC